MHTLIAYLIPSRPDPVAVLVGLILVSVYVCLAIEVWTTRPRR